MMNTPERRGKMSIVQQKYLRDENGEVFSPIVEASSVIINRGDAAQTVEEIIPYTYRVSSSAFSTALPIFTGSISNWSMIKANFKVWTSELTTTKATYLRLNDTNSDGGYAIDARRRDDTWESYNPVNFTTNIFLGDIAYSGNTSYMELTIINGGTWHSFKNVMSNVTSTKAQYTLSVCSGQFSHSDVGKTLSSLKLIASQGIQAQGIIQIYT